MSKFIMKIVCYFKKHFVTRIRNFAFTYKKSIKGKCSTIGKCIIFTQKNLLMTALLTYAPLALLKHRPSSMEHQQQSTTSATIIRAPLVLTQPTTALSKKEQKRVLNSEEFLSMAGYTGTSTC